MPTPARDSRREIRRVWCFCWSSADATTSSTSSSSSSSSTEADCARKRPERPTRFRGGRSVEWAVPAVFHGPCCSFFLIASGVPDSFRVRDAIWRRFWLTGGLAPEQERRTFLLFLRFSIFLFFVHFLFVSHLYSAVDLETWWSCRAWYLFFFNLFFFPSEFLLFGWEDWFGFVDQTERLSWSNFIVLYWVSLHFTGFSWVFF